MAKSGTVSLGFMRRNMAHIVSVFLFIGMFSGIGVWLRYASSAETLADSAAVRLSLAPSNATLKHGDVINMAVTLDVNSGPAVTRSEAIVRFPSSLQLEGVQQVCPHSSFDATDKQVINTGVIDIACSNQAGVTGRHTLGSLTFKALTDTVAASVTIEQATSRITTADTKTVTPDISNASLQLDPTTSDSVVTPRTVAEVKSRPSGCADAQPGSVRCHSELVVGDNNDPVLQPHASNGYGPKEFHNAYQMPCTPGGPVASVCATPSSYGPTIAIVDAYGYPNGASGVESDLTAFSQNYGIPTCTVSSGCLKVVNQTGGTSLPAEDGKGKNGWAGETVLDVQAAHVMCQTCHILLVLSNTSNTSNMDAAQAYAASQKPVTISDSWSGGGDTESKFNNPGIAQFVATGDDGIVTTANAPADYPETIAVGGTTLNVNTDGTRSSETTWSGSGGGCSTTNATPSWQSALSNWSAIGCDNRGMNDVAADGNPSTGLLVYYQGSWSLTGGTSLSAPLMAGMFALSNPSGTANQNIGPLLYAHATNNMYDITSGSNCTTSTNNAFCKTSTGFDLPSGLGVPRVAALQTITTPCTAAPSAPPGITTPAASATSVTLNWSASTPGAGCSISGYKVFRNGTLVTTVSGSVQAYTDTGLTANTSYTYTVTALDGSNHESSASPNLTAKTATDSIAPSTPGTITAPVSTVTSIALTWPASTDNIAVVGYYVYRNGTQIGQTSSASYTDTGLSPATAYTYTVKAFDGAGNTSPASSSATFSTLAGTAPTVIPGDINGDGKVNIVDLSILFSHWTGN